VKSYRLMERSVKLVLRLISLFQFPLLRPFLKELLTMVADLRSEKVPATAAAQTVE
jgi:hypothetical protein